MARRLTLLTLLLLAPVALAAQQGKSPSPTDSLVLAHDFTARGEFARVELVAGTVYRVEATNAHQLSVRNRHVGTQLPLTRIIEDLTRPSNTSAFELEPSVSGEYELRVLGRPLGLAAVRVFVDRHATRRQRRVAEG